MSLAILSATSLARGAETVSYPSGAETLKGFLALPSANAPAKQPGKRPAVILIHEWWGLNDWVKTKARSFADEGYVALAVDLYRGQVAADADAAHQLMRGLPEDRALRDLQAAMRYLSSRPDVDGHIGVVGWCMGGGYSLSLAVAEPKLSAAVIYYGRLLTDPVQIAKIKAPLLGNFGATDQGIPAASVTEFASQAQKAGVHTSFKVYPVAGHGFASSKDPKVFRADDAKDADARTNSFFLQYLVGLKK
jgi:carboxymethylenebutenolidase